MAMPTSHDLREMVRRTRDHLQDAQLGLGAIEKYSSSTVATALRADVQRIRDVVRSMQVIDETTIRPNRRRRTSRRRTSRR